MLQDGGAYFLNVTCTSLRFKLPRMQVSLAWSREAAIPAFRCVLVAQADVGGAEAQPSRARPQSEPRRVRRPLQSSLRERMAVMPWNLITQRWGCTGQGPRWESVPCPIFLETRRNETIREGGERDPGDLNSGLVFTIACCDVLNTRHLSCSVSTCVTGGAEGN